MSLLRKARRNTLKTILFWACLLIPASAFLYTTNAHVRGLEKEMEDTQRAIAQEKESLRVLHAEWAYLNNPERLAAEAKKHLDGAEETKAAQILSLPTLGTKLAMRGGPASPSDATGMVTIANAANAQPGVLAKSIAYDGSALAALHNNEDSRIPAAASWSPKMVSALGFAPSPLPLKSNSTP
ncbi:MAG TPA: hypothetical protein VHB73_05315 [Alphaproteobacteria bacterium]|nr:hypothetical protein [Alphaproteobacteria bacterium]